MFNSLVMPLLVNPQVTEVDYSEFMRMTQEKKIDKVMVENNQIIFSDNEGKLYNTGLMDDPQLTQRLYDSGAKFSSQIVK
ncbi:MAG: ATP-dependent metallopeptidase FtsH/Yme1/Tma family protein, partial [Clostridia bacterium]|nr:ATP-dependent metallopeptidase FtsH/Yme1/Tma family protein [Clostridia bacterium]